MKPTRFILFCGLILSACSHLPAGHGTRQPDAEAGRGLFTNHEVLRVVLRADFANFFKAVRAAADEDLQKAKALSTQGKLIYFDGGLNRDVALNIRIKARGNTSLDADECAFPKLEIKLLDKTSESTTFRGISEFKIGTHCADLPDSKPTAKGRLGNERSPVREAFVYQVLEILGIPAQRSRPVEMDYRDLDGGGSVPRQAFFLEDLGEMAGRYGGKSLKYQSASEMPPEEGSENSLPVFTSARQEKVNLDDLAGVFLAQALIGNYDWEVRVSTKEATFDSLANTKVVGLPDGTRIIVPQDFDLATAVTGNVAMAPGYPPDAAVSVSGNSSPLFNYALMRLARVYQMFSAKAVESWKARFTQKRSEIVAALDRSNVDPDGKKIFIDHMEEFFTAFDRIQTLPRVVKGGTKYFLDPALKQDCEGETLAVGAPVKLLEEKNGILKIRVLDFRNEYACPNREVWIRKGSLSVL